MMLRHASEIWRSPSPESPLAIPQPRNVASELRAATERGSGRVVIALGHRAVGAGEEIMKLAERIGAPVLTRLDATLGTGTWRPHLGQAV